MVKPRLLDLFCGEGGASHGYALAGFDVTGVDNKPRKRYPYRFIEADATTYPLDGFDALAGSPPCHDHSSLRSLTAPSGDGWMLQHTIDRFAATGLPYVVENVSGAEMPTALVLCGSEFGLVDDGFWLKRHRRFASNVLLMGAGGCHCSGRRIGGVYGHGGGWSRSRRGYKLSADAARRIMGAPWMSRDGLSQAIPPAYTKFIGEQLIDWINRA